MPGSRRLVVALVTVVAIAATVTSAWYLVRTPNRLGPGASDTEAGFYESKVGDWLNVAMSPFNPHGADPVRVRAVRVTGLPRGLRVVGLHALRTPVAIGAVSGDLRKLHPSKYDYRPVTEMVFREGKPEEWALLVIVEATQPGDWHTTGIDVEWSAGRHVAPPTTATSSA